MLHQQANHVRFHLPRALSDQVAEGALDLDCQLLAWLAARAVDWPKTGVWRAEDTKLFEIIQRRVSTVVCRRCVV